VPKLDYVESNGNGQPQNGEVAAEREMLAVSLRDLDRMAQEMRLRMLRSPDGKPRLDFSQAVPGGRDDDPAVAFTCPLLTAATICDVIRSHDRQVGDPLTKVYLRSGSRWANVYGDVLFTLVGTDGKAQLNPAVFAVEVEKVPVVAPRRRPVEL